MLTSLRSRLWATYLLIIFISIFILSLGILISLGQNPYITQQSAIRVRLASSYLAPRINNIILNHPDKLSEVLSNESQIYDTRFIIFDNSSKIIVDTDLDKYPKITKNIISDKDLLITKTNIGKYEDINNNQWIFKIQPLAQNHILITATIFNEFPIFSLLKDELFRPILLSSLISLFLSFIISIFMSKWISNPLKNMVINTSKIESNTTQLIPVNGPKEIQLLSQSFNSMLYKVQASQKSQQEFLTNISHELKTPLTSIQGYSQAILDETIKDTSETKNAAKIIHNEASRLNRLVINLLSLSKLESHTAPFEFNTINISIVFNNVIDKFDLLAKERNIIIQREIEEEQYIYGDGDRLSQVFTNLIDNAIKFSTKNSYIVCKSFSKNNKACIEIIDHGNGISEEDLEKIFKRFYQTNNSKNNKHQKGFGLGLPIAQEIIKKHGSEIYIKSIMNQGSTFYFCLPLDNSKKPTLLISKKEL